jgi:Fe-S cluster assembly ATPase SufC
MERTSPKRIRIGGCNAVVLEAEQVNEQLILAEGLAERAQVSVKEAADREKIEKLAAADREKNETLAAGDCKRAEQAQTTSCEAHAIDEAIHASGLDQSPSKCIGGS